MISQAEAEMTAATLVLAAAQAMDRKRLLEIFRSEDVAAIQSALVPIETWLRRRAVGGDKILLRQMEQPTARQVRPSAKDRKRLEGR